MLPDIFRRPDAFGERRQAEADVVILDLAMPQLNGIDAAND